MTDKELEERLKKLKEDNPLNTGNALKIQERLEIECLLAKRTYNIDITSPIEIEKLIKKIEELENEIYFLTLEMNQVLNKLTDGGRCFNENN